ncbi:hypothetical protein [Aquimarina sp. 2201CG5-10]|uniref:hypothetical protein n=1 Tax=Aquimarina callyspongiae TaxID=3098150 RepID=UPI002AB5C647|nr:hypothetical protein [Aquimarina sp. 2201CG5-10]MDY8137989.1 hypothetical protein [Aquimarina sp. 2201CG5-10]
MSKSQRLRNLSNHPKAVPKSGTSIKWRTIIALVLMYIALIMDWQWAWGILFLLWVIPDLLSGVTYFVEPVEKKTSPFLYWVIIISWILMALYSISVLFIDYDQFYY